MNSKAKALREKIQNASNEAKLRNTDNQIKDIQNGFEKSFHESRIEKHYCYGSEDCFHSSPFSHWLED